MKLWLKIHVLPYLAFALHRLLSWTWRVDTYFCDELKEDWKAGRPTVYAHWHKDETTLIINIREMRAGILNSKSTDGRLMQKVVQLYGAKTADGSSSRDGVQALKGLIRLAKSGRNPTVAVDGPRGPYKVIKPGIMQLSRLCNAKIYPGTIQYSRAWQFPKSWDKTYLPKPFSKITIYWGPPMDAVQKKQDPKSPELAEKLAEHFAESERKSVKFFTESRTE